MAAAILTDDLKPAFVADWHAGVPVDVLAKKYGFANKTSATTAARRLCLPYRNTYVDFDALDREKFAADWANKALSSAVIAERHGLTRPETAGHVAGKLGLPRRKPGPASYAQREVNPNPTELRGGRWVTRGGVRRWVTS